MSHTTFEVKGSDGRPVRAVRHGDAERPTVLVAHGFKGFKDWGMFPWICDQIEGAGLSAVRFDFSHNGVEETDFDRLDLFLLDTAERHQDDLAAIAEAIDGPFGIVGHSRGGADAIVFGANQPRVACVATLASVSTFEAPFPDADAVLRERGFYPIPNARTGQIMPVGRPQFEVGERVSVEDAARRLSQPAFFVHGTADESVPVGCVDRLGSWAPDAEVVKIEGAGHTFGGVHPWQGPTPHLEAAMAAIAPFLVSHLD